MSMGKFAFYLDTTGIEGARFLDIEGGNPGCGGTQYATISLAHELAKAGNTVDFYVNSPIVVHSSINLSITSSFFEAATKSIASSSVLVFTAPREISFDIQSGLQLQELHAIAWMHIDPLPKTLRELAAFQGVKVFVALGNRQLLRYINSPISHKVVQIKNGQYLRVEGFDDKEPKSVTYIGALVPQKGFHILAEAWPEVIKKHPDAVLNVVGSGNLHNYRTNSLSGRIAESAYLSDITNRLGESISSVRFLGRISAVEKDSVVCRSLVGVVNPTGNTENCPASALDFQSFGVPVIAGRKRGNIDVIANNRSGWLIPISSKKLASKIVEVLEAEKDFLECYAANCRLFVQNEFNFNFIVQEWMGVESECRLANPEFRKVTPLPRTWVEFLRIFVYFLNLPIQKVWRNILKLGGQKHYGHPQ